MRNAKYHDVQQALTYTPPTNVMFNVVTPYFGVVKAHIKSIAYFNSDYPTGLWMESAAGGLLFHADWSWLKPVPRKQGTPTKQKKPHVKGSKPWLAKYEYTDYDPSLVKAGTKVLCRDKKIRTVISIETIGRRNPTIKFNDNRCVWLSNGKNSTIAGIEAKTDIKKIIVEKNIEKPKHDKYKGYEVGKWHFWQGDSSTPPVDGDVVVQYWMRSDNVFCKIAENKAQDLHWNWCKEGGYCSTSGTDIIAFKIIP